MACSLGLVEPAGAAHGRVIHVLLAQTEQRIVATLDGYVDELVAVRAGVDGLLTMIDRAEFLYLCRTPELPPAAQDRALRSGEQQLTHWRRAVTRMLEDSGRSVPWPLPDPEPADRPMSSERPAGDAC